MPSALDGEAAPWKLMKSRISESQMHPEEVVKDKFFWIDNFAKVGVASFPIAEGRPLEVEVRILRSL